jgi:predicted neutral ceramidase superfamily lipid hydrolase
MVDNLEKFGGWGMNLRRWKPAVPRRWLLLVSGGMWTVAGGMLCFFAYGWLAVMPLGRAELLAVAGMLLALAIYRFGFSRLAFRNTRRIYLLSARACVFAFQAWHSYVTVAAMMTLGIVLRQSAFPRSYLAIIYAGIGGGLLFSSWHYFHRFAHGPHEAS